MSTATTASVRPDADAAARLTRSDGQVTPSPRRRAPFFVEFWRSAIGKKWVMAVTGIMLLGYVLAHMAGNVKLYLGPKAIDDYGEWLRTLGEPAFPRTIVLWFLRFLLASAFALHIAAAYSLTRMNRRARPVRYQSHRDYVAANFASRTMRWTGIIVGLFVIFHLLDLTWGPANPSFVRGSVYHNVVESFQRVPIAIVYMLANIALGIHIFHGAWSMFQSLGLNNPRFNKWRLYFARTFAAIIVIGNCSFPIMVQLGVLS